MVKKYLSLVKFSHTIFALPFAFIGFFMGLYFVAQQQSATMVEVLQQKQMLQLFFLVLLCMVTARSAAMAFNRYLDRSFDAKNPRTAIREIPSGVIAASSALRFVILNAVIFIAVTYYINPICFYLSPVALFVILFYSYTKRFTALCHIVLGLGLSLAPIGAYLAVTGTFAILPILFSCVVICWVSGFDIIYAMQDVDFDASQNLHSIPTYLGKVNALKLSVLLHVVAAALVIVAGLLAGYGYFYWEGALVFIGMLYYQHSIVSPTNLTKVNIAFMTANGIASVIFGIHVLVALFLK
jgi:4-hydroxybenzoate polyprenyltransferase